MGRLHVARPFGFTLVELMVIVAIVAVLAALLLPALQTVRAKVHESVCASNLHQLHLAVKMYLQDYDEVFPISYVAARAGPYYSWRETIAPYVRSRDVLLCPASEHRGQKYEELSPERRASYALNAWLSPPDLTAIGGTSGVPVALSAVGESSGTIMLCDAGYSNAPVALDYDHYLSLGMQEQPLPTERHNDAANFCFVDGHVKRMPETRTREPVYLWDLD